ncbi:hypothetical protein [Lederbergia citrea]|uniref:Uncharacterized protein n=1 Tax=Lederbergia citrea TaxID=2833581 RepID=A0A942UPP7_9BACI|nr:hypothetical protein [Lederbergia citrea]MBS4221779.1 hypothetical protein [Lederbergia citrea]
MKKDIVTGLFVFLIAITIFSVMRESDVKSVATNLQDDNDSLMKQIANFEQELVEKTTKIEELSEENQLLIEDLSASEKEVTLLKTSTEYQAFLNAINSIESYKTSKTFKEASEFISNGQGFATMDREGTCPCSFDFKGTPSLFEWIPNAVQELKEFRIEGEKILLTYTTNEDIGHNYLFVMTKAIGVFTQDKKWRIEAIQLIAK